MRKIEFAEVAPLSEYERMREASRRRVIELKRRRRVQVGDHLSFVFENRETVLFQIQEMLRAERIVEEARVRDEIDVYNDLIPGEGELSATLFIEIEDPALIKEILDRLMGIDVGEHVWIEIGGVHAIPGVFEAGHSDEERGKLSAVHFVRFRFSPAEIRAFRERDAFLVVDHPGERARVRIPDEVKASLLQDFGG